MATTGLDRTPRVRGFTSIESASGEKTLLREDEHTIAVNAISITATIYFLKEIMPSACVSPVIGAISKRRIRTILIARVAGHLSVFTKAMWIVIVCVLAMVSAIGMLHVSRVD